MGTRADFYVGRGSEAEWIGSTAYDGYPSGIPALLRAAATEHDFRSLVASYFSDRNDVTLPDDGWPWPWDDSRTTDYAYAFDGEMVYGSCFGHAWFDAFQGEIDDPAEGAKVAVFPDMAARKAIAHGKRSGIISISRNADGSMVIE